MKLVWNGDKVLAEFAKLKEPLEQKSAKNIEQKAKAGCPVATGALKNSITVRQSKFKDGGYTVGVGSDKVYYASFVELGVPKRPGIPFLRRAAESEGSKFEKAITSMIKTL